MVARFANLTDDPYGADVAQVEFGSRGREKLLIDNRLAPDERRPVVLFKIHPIDRS